MNDAKSKTPCVQMLPGRVDLPGSAQTQQRLFATVPELFRCINRWRGNSRASIQFHLLSYQFFAGSPDELRGKLLLRYRPSIFAWLISTPGAR